MYIFGVMSKIQEKLEASGNFLVIDYRKIWGPLHGHVKANVETGGQRPYRHYKKRSENSIREYKFDVRRNGRQGATYSSVVKQIALKIKSSFDRGRLVAESIETNTKKEPSEPILQVSTLTDAERKKQRTGSLVWNIVRHRKDTRTRWRDSKKTG